MSELQDTDLLRIAARASGAGRLDGADVTAKVRNPFCGDRLTLDLKFSEGRVTQVGYEIRACLVCQASTGLVAEQVVGKSRDDLAALGAEVEAFLKGEAERAPAGFDVFGPVKPHLNRHVCVMMPFKGVADAE